MRLGGGSLRANASLVSPNLSNAREKAKQAFKDFYGEQLFEIAEGAEA